MVETLSPGISRKNYFSFLWHAAFLALAMSFLDIDTIIPAMLVEAGGTSVHIGLKDAILTVCSSFSILTYIPYY
ncbi:MAG: hypothetical protein J7L96_08235 [Bacteroidales bacterium]|nr:hypothetical protein [Bacteroidales bacterium]